MVEKRNAMKRWMLSGFSVCMCVVALLSGQPRVQVQAADLGHDNHGGDPLLVLPEGYRDWRLISVAHEAGKLNDLRAVLGNDAAIGAYRREQLPFPDGTLIARLAWAYTPSEQNNKAFGQEQSFVAGTATNVQIMVKDSMRFASTGGWGFAQFNDGKPAPPEATKACFSCHVPARTHDYVFTYYAR